MASPPFRSPATSPPYPAHMSLPNPKKRPSLSVSSHLPAAKRRKPTNVSQVSTPGTSHPLRQTSFPPEESAIERSPSVESDMTGVTGSQSALTAGPGKPKAKRGRRRKTEDVSIVSGGKTTAADGGSVAGQAADEGAEDDEDDAEGEEGAVGENEMREKEIESADLAILMENFTRDQMDRYESMRRHRLRKETVRKIVNQTLSQSVPPSVVTAIGGFAKVLVGSLVERARDVQEQQAASYLPSPPLSQKSQPQTTTTTTTTTATSSQATVQATSSTTTPTPESSFPSQQKQQPSQTQLPPPPTSNNNNNNDSQDLDSDLDPPPEINHNIIYNIDSGGEGLQARSQPTQDGSPQSKKKQKMQMDLGPLLPDHLREALRRYKKEGEGAGIGFGGTSVGLGVQGTVAAGRWRGRRLLS